MSLLRTPSNVQLEQQIGFAESPDEVHEKNTKNLSVRF
jgi:hypothetical protein